eukprot:24584_1
MASVTDKTKIVNDIALQTLLFILYVCAFRLAIHQMFCRPNRELLIVKIVIIVFVLGYAIEFAALIITNSFKYIALENGNKIGKDAYISYMLVIISDFVAASSFHLLLIIKLKYCFQGTPLDVHARFAAFLFIVYVLSLLSLEIVYFINHCVVYWN